MNRLVSRGAMLGLALCALATAALAQTPPAPTPNKGDTAWLLVSTALVLMMSIPGLALFYGGLVRTKNMLSVLTQVFMIVSLVAVIWVVYGYSLAFTEGGALNQFVGGLSRAFSWTEKREGVIAPDERLPWGQTIAVGVQHIFAMFGATVLAPILMGFDPNTAIFFSGIGTLIFFVLTAGRVPSYLGSSFAFIAVA